MRVVPLPALADNYVFALVSESAPEAALVDPGEAEPAAGWLEREQLAVGAILLTHHHRDHTGGVSSLLLRSPRPRVIGAARDRRRLPPLDQAVADGDRVQVLGLDVRVLEVPGHTSGHVAYFVADPQDPAAGDLFSGDTLFGATIGNLFEGTPDDMYGSLVKIRSLPVGTRIWCAHEYTLQYVCEAARFDPENALLAERLRRLEAVTSRPSVPLLLSEERATNPFLRWDDPDLVARLGTEPGLATFRRLCELL